MSIAVQWVVFSELSTDAMIATGITWHPLFSGRPAGVAAAL